MLLSKNPCLCLCALQYTKSITCKITYKLPHSISFTLTHQMALMDVNYCVCLPEINRSNESKQLLKYSRPLILSLPSVIFFHSVRMCLCKSIDIKFFFLSFLLSPAFSLHYTGIWDSWVCLPIVARLGGAWSVVTASRSRPLSLLHFLLRVSCQLCGTASRPAVAGDLCATKKLSQSPGRALPAGSRPPGL